MGLSTTYTKTETDFLIQQLEKKASSGYKGDLIKTDVAPTSVGFYGLLETGIYTNLGGINAPIGKLNFASFDGTTWSLIAADLPQPIVNKYTNNNTYNLDPGQIVPSEALYNDPSETLAGDVLKRVDKTTGRDVNYRKSIKAFNDKDINDDILNAFPTIFKKINNDFFKLEVAEWDVRLFGAVGDGITDDSAAIQNAVLFCEYFQIKKLRVPTGNYLINSKVVFNRGGVRIVGEGALSREESWIGFSLQDFPQNYPLGVTDTFTGCTFTIPENSVGFEFSKSVVDNVYFSDVQFLAKNGRTIGNTRAIDFLAEFYGPTWNFVIERCHFRGFNKAINISSPTQYCVAFVDITYCSFSQNDEILYFDNIPDDKITTVGSRNLAWGLTFMQNRCHHNSRLIRGAFAKDLVKISQNNVEGSIAYSDGTSPKYAIDLELINCNVIFEGNHAESVNHDIFFATTFLRDKNGNRHTHEKNPTRGSACTVTIKGNNFDGVNNNKVPITLEGVALYDYDNYGAKLHGCSIKFSGASSAVYSNSDSAKSETSLYVFAINDIENIVYRDKNNLSFCGNAVGQLNKDSFIMWTPFGQKQVTKFKASNGSLFNYSGMPIRSSNKYWGCSFLFNANKKFDFFPNVVFYVNYSVNGIAGSMSEGATVMTNNFRKGWNILTAIFPIGKLPNGAIVSSVAIGLPSGELQQENVIIDSYFTVFTIDDENYLVAPYYRNNVQYYEKQGTFEVGQMFYDNTGVLNICTKAGTISATSGITATANVGDNFFLANDATKLTVGGYINIGGYNYRIMNIEGNKVYINDPFIVDPLSNSEVNWVAPIFKTINMNENS